MTNVVYETVPKSTYIKNGIYSRDISVEKAALDVMINAYQAKKPVDTVNVQHQDINVAAPNPFSNSSIYPTNGTTPVVQNMSEIPVGTQIAPGINEVNPNISEFQPVTSLDNPMDLMVNNQIPNQNSFNVASFPQEQAKVSTQPSIISQGSLDEKLQSLIETNASEEQIREIVIQKIGDVISNYVDLLGRKTAEDLARKKAELDKREAELNIMKQGIEAKLSSQFAMPQQPVMQSAIPQQPTYPTQQNIITEYSQGNAFNNQLDNGRQFTAQPPIGQYQQQENNGFRQVA